MRIAVTVVLVAGLAAVLWAVGIGGGLAPGDNWVPPPDSGVIASPPVDTEPLGTAPPEARSDYPTEVAIAIAPSDPETMYVSAGERGLFRTTDRGKTWQPLPVMGQYGANVLAVSPSDPMLVVAGGDKPYRSSDGGETWRVSAAGFDSIHIYAAAASSSAFYVYGDGGELPSDPGSGFFRSTDEGLTWSRIGDDQVWAVQAIAVHTGGSATVHAGTNGDGVFTSHDSGTSWRQTSARMPVRFGHLPDVRALAIAPSRARTLYAGSGTSGAFASDDGARTWRSLGLGGMYVWSIAVSPSDHRRVIVSVGGSEDGKLPGGLYRTVDRGRSWRLLAASGLVAAYDPTGVLYSVGQGGTVLRSPDDGVTWTKLVDLKLGPGFG